MPGPGAGRARAAAAASLITAPLLGLVAGCAWPPLRSDERAQIAAISAQPDRWYIFSGSSPRHVRDRRL